MALTAFGIIIIPNFAKVSKHWQMHEKKAFLLSVINYTVKIVEDFFFIIILLNFFTTKYMIASVSTSCCEGGVD